MRKSPIGARTVARRLARLRGILKTASRDVSDAGRVAIAAFERDLIAERTGEGRKRALAKGIKFGRKPKLSDYQRQEAIRRRKAGETQASGGEAFLSLLASM